MKQISNYKAKSMDRLSEVSGSLSPLSNNKRGEIKCDSNSYIDSIIVIYPSSVCLLSPVSIRGESTGTKA